MKCALITPYSTGNIGTVLQAYATQKLIEDMGHKVDIIAFIWEDIENPYLFRNLVRRGVKAYLAAIAGHLSRQPRRKALEKFIKERLSLTEKFTKERLSLLNEKYDYFLVGSDCVWNAEMFGLETTYLLNFVNDSDKKGNYASSFASDAIPEEYKEIYKKYLSEFRFLSVREKKGQQQILELIGKDVPVVLDPTLLCNSDFWLPIARESVLDIDEEYIFVAEYSISKKMLTDAQILAKKHNCKIICAFPPKGKTIRASVMLSAGPKDFLYLLKNAKYVLTDSYHMSIFAVNFNIQFWSYITNTVVPSYSKYESIMADLNLLDRIIYDNKYKSNDIDFDEVTDIDFTSVNKTLGMLRKNSYNYLKNQLDEVSTK